MKSTATDKSYQSGRGRFALPAICEALLAVGLITSDNATEILKREKLFKLKHVHRTGDDDGAGPFVAIDRLLALNLQRADDPSKRLDEDDVYFALSRKWKIPFKKIDPLKLDLGLVTSTIPHSFARKHLVLPIEQQNNCLLVATPNPFNLEVFDDITRVCQLKVRPILSSKSDIVKFINEFFGFKRSIAAAENQFNGTGVDLGNLEQYVRLGHFEEVPSNDQHVINAVNHLLGYAFEQRASDIHVEPKRVTSLVRMRIDGVLHTVYKLPKNVHSAILSRIKNLSRLDMAEKRKPQDGRIKMDKDGIEVEIRVSTVPVAFGEKAVLRLMDPKVLFQKLAGLGFSPTDLKRYNSFVNMPHGIVLVCGPTGSGKSTTLYSTLRDLATPEINVTTVEDPIEMIHDQFNQIAVQPAVNVTFATILRNILRQDPDIIMVGEIRDLETAENAVQAALTGHLVLSTLHTNDAPTSIIRLLDLGVPPFLIQASLVGILSQRLVRKICPYCTESFIMDHAKLRAMGLRVPQDQPIELKRGKGCVRCRNTGYLGRMGLFEVLPYTEQIKKMTTAKTDLDVLRRQARKEGMRTLRECGIRRMLQGRTSYEEVLRVTWAD